MVMMLPMSVSFAKRTIGPRCWTYDFHHDRLGTLGRIVLTALPDNANTNISCELAENPDRTLTERRRDMFEPLALEISNRLEQAFAHRLITRS